MLAVFNSQTRKGNWVLTASDNAGGDTGTLAGVVRGDPVTDPPSSGPPNIDVDPLSMASTQAPNTSTQPALDVSNTGGEDLTWTIVEEPDALRLPTGVSRGIEKAEASRQVTIGDATLSHSTLTPGQVVTPERPDTPDGLVTITHSVSQAIVSGNSVSCNNASGHTDNSYLRQFDLSAFGITGALAVTQVQIGVEAASAAAASR